MCRDYLCKGEIVFANTLREKVNDLCEPSSYGLSDHLLSHKYGLWLVLLCELFVTCPQKCRSSDCLEMFMENLKTI